MVAARLPIGLPAAGSVCVASPVQERERVGRMGGGQIIFRLAAVAHPLEWAPGRCRRHVLSLPPADAPLAGAPSTDGDPRDPRRWEYRLGFARMGGYEALSCRLCVEFTPVPTEMCRRPE